MGYQSSITFIFTSSFILESYISYKIVKNIDCRSDHYLIINDFNLPTIQIEE